MRIFRLIASALALLVPSLFCFPATAQEAGPVAAHYHFGGPAQIANDPSFNMARKLMAERSSIAFRELLTWRLAGIFWNELQLQPHGNSGGQIRPLLEDLLNNESAGSFGGTHPQHLDFALAVKLNAPRAAAWQKTLATVLGGSGEAVAEDGFAGRVWKRGYANSFWLFQARDWTVVARGEDLAPAMSTYLRRIQQTGRPAPALGENWLELDADWARLGQWIPISDIPLKPARTILQLTARGGRFRANGRIIYAEPINWHSSPWRPPKSFVSEPLISFTTGQDVQPFLRSKTPLAGLAADPFTDQFFCWAQGEMDFQSYVAWPVPDAPQKLRQEAPQLLSIFNPKLAADHSKLIWNSRASEINWRLPNILAPLLTTVHDDNTEYLMGEFFPLSSHTRPVPAALWPQFERPPGLVYWDYEQTGPRLQQWRLLSEMLPVLPGTTGMGRLGGVPSYVIIDKWLANLTPYLGATVTEVARSSDTEFSLKRTSQFVFTSFELVWLSHWLTGTPAGPIDYSLLPHAKITGPGIPAH